MREERGRCSAASPKDEKHWQAGGWSVVVLGCLFCRPVCNVLSLVKVACIVCLCGMAGSSICVCGGSSTSEDETPWAGGWNLVLVGLLCASSHT